MSDVLRAMRGAKIVLDHHVSGDELGAEVFRDAESPATGCLVVEAADALDVAITSSMATPLFAAIMTDTGWLRFSSTTSETFRTAARLVAAGADPTSLYQTLYEQDSLACVQLRGRALVRARTELAGRLIHTTLRRADFAETGAAPSDTEGIINLLLAVAGAETAVMLTEQLETTAVKASFRSRGNLDCSALARSLGGGGHKQAAGVYLEGEFDAVAARVLDAARAGMG
jgi:phosphoesterase RecJ-like protein